MDHYIKEALKDSKTIILPGFGALTKINETTGELMFMDYLKHDDGVLAQFISQKEGISEQEAKNLLAKHSREITAILNKGEVYSIYNFGTFFKNSQGNYEFEQFQSSTNATSELNEINTPDDDKIKQESKTQQEEVNLDQEDGSEVIATKQDDSTSDSAKNFTNQVNDQKSKSIPIDPEVEISKVDANSKHQRTAASQNEQKQEKKSIESVTPTTPSKRRKYVIVALLFLFASGTIGAVLYLFVFDKKLDVGPNKTQVANKTVPNSITETKSESTDSLNTLEQIEINDSIQKETIESTESKLESENLAAKPYKIVAGTFQKLQFAESFADKLLQEKGLKSEIVSRNYQNFVILDSFENSKIANEALKKLKKKIKKAWILNSN
jgi:nucleoid DNA-binding protein